MMKLMNVTNAIEMIDELESTYGVDNDIKIWIGSQDTGMSLSKMKEKVTYISNNISITDFAITSISIFSVPLLAKWDLLDASTVNIHVPVKVANLTHK